MKRILLFPYTFVVMNWAAVAGFYYFVTGRKDLWSSGRCQCRQRELRSNR